MSRAFMSPANTTATFMHNINICSTNICSTNVCSTNISNTNISRAIK